MSRVSAGKRCAATDSGPRSTIAKSASDSVVTASAAMADRLLRRAVTRLPLGLRYPDGPAAAAAPNQLTQLGFEEVFERMWEFCLAYSEARLRSGELDVFNLERRGVR
jgi:hypothetical protein